MGVTGDHSDARPDERELVERMQRDEFEADAPMNAADVLAEAFNAATSEPRVDYGHHIDALLAHGGQGVAILPDGTLWALKAFPSGAAYRLVPLSAEAGDTDGD